MMKYKEKKYEDDDGRVICNMDVPGMRWYDKKSLRMEENTPQGIPGDQLTRSEARRYNWYAVLAGLVIVLVFSTVWVLFTLFCTQIWFR